MLALVLVLGCGKAQAVPVGAGLPVPQAPAGWQEMPDMAKAIAAATTGDVHAWGEPARGCYAAWLALPGGAGSDAVERDLRGVKGLTVRDVAHPAAGEVALAFERAPYHGRLRAATGDRSTALACFWNEREPAACAAACAKLLGGAP